MAKNEKRQKPLIMRGNVTDNEGRKIGTRAINAADLKATRVPRHESLSDDFKARAAVVYRRLGKIGRRSQSVEAWTDDFRFETTPERELRAWQCVATAVEKVWHHPVSKGILRDDLEHAAILLSLGTVDVPSQIPAITDAVVAELATEYAAAQEHEAEG